MPLADESQQKSKRYLGTSTRCLGTSTEKLHPPFIFAVRDAGLEFRLILPIKPPSPYPDRFSQFILAMPTAGYAYAFVILACP
jgi:hypothetical protein